MRNWNGSSAPTPLGRGGRLRGEFGRDRVADAIRQEGEQRFNEIGIRDRLLARRNQTR